MAGKKYSNIDTVNNALNFLLLDAEIIASESGGLLNRYDVERLNNVNFVADYIRHLEERNESLRKRL